MLGSGTSGATHCRIACVALWCAVVCCVPTTLLRFGTTHASHVRTTCGVLWCAVVCFAVLWSVNPAALWNIKYGMSSCSCDVLCRAVPRQPCSILRHQMHFVFVQSVACCEMAHMLRCTVTLQACCALEHSACRVWHLFMQPVVCTLCV